MMDQPKYIGDNYKTSSKFRDDSRLVLGTSGLGGVWGDVDKQKSVNTILAALKNGVSVFDTSPSYKDAELFLGKALRQWDGERPFLSTKVGRLRGETATDMKLDYSRDAMLESVENSLRKLGVDYVDLLFLHEPQMVPMDRIDEILETLETFKSEGLTQKLGIGGNPEGKFWDYVKGEYFDVLSSFTKMDACNLDAFKREIPLTESENIAIYAASPLHMGLFGSKFNEYASGEREASWIKDRNIKNGARVNEIAKEHNISLPEVAFRYLFSIKQADRVVIGPRTHAQMVSALEYWENGPLPEEMFDQITDVLLTSLKKNS